MSEHDRPSPRPRPVETEPVSQGFMISGRLYDFLKFFALILLPAIATLYFSLSTVWGLPSSQNVVGSIVAVDTFLGAILGISSSNYKNSDTKFDGDFVVEPAPGGKRVYSLQLNDGVEDQLHKKDELTFKLVGH